MSFVGPGGLYVTSQLVDEYLKEEGPR